MIIMGRYYKIPNLMYVIKNDWLDWRVPSRKKLSMLFKLSDFVYGWINSIIVSLFLVIPIYMLGMAREDIFYVLGLILSVIVVIALLNVFLNIYDYNKNKDKWVRDNVCLFNQYE